ncbi:MAG: UDP-N-acetylmuramoyl-L-alanyl-D-glutamate--2,6-diaminopimelate ligase [Gammaproteobacteria bacterium]
MQLTSLAELLTNLPQSPALSSPNKHSLNQITITGITADSRDVQPGDLFIARRGQQFDGRQFIQQAEGAGAVAVLTEVQCTYTAMNIPVLVSKNLHQDMAILAQCFYGVSSQRMPIIGVTGTNGKTSICHFIAQLLNRIGKPCGMLGTLGNGVFPHLRNSTHTTTDVVSTHRLLAELAQQGANYTAMEVSSHGLDQGRVDQVKFAVGVFTNLTRDHLDYHHTMHNYGMAKRLLFSKHQPQHAIMNYDDNFGRQLFAEFQASLDCFSYSTLATQADIYAQDIQLSNEGIRAQVHTPEKSFTLFSQLLGQHNLSNLLAVIAVLIKLQIPIDTWAQHLVDLQPPPGRMQRFQNTKTPVVVVDYAHTPDALTHALQALRAHCEGRLWCVFGCGGERDVGKRPLMGRVAAQYADQIVITNDNPRNEDPVRIVADIIAQLPQRAKMRVQYDRRQAIAEVINTAQPKDIVLIAGKGHEEYQIIGNDYIAYSDIAWVQELLNEPHTIS